MIATSEIRRKDRRGVIPQHILYMAMKIMRLRMVDGIYNTFRSATFTENITRGMLEDPEFLDQCLEKNFSFLKSIPNSVQYWHNRKKDLFAMVRQLGKPTMFLTMSVNEIRWPHLLRTLHHLSDLYPNIVLDDPLVDLDRVKRSNLVNEDPVTYCIYFYKLVCVILKMLQSKYKYNPFYKYRVMEYFLRIKFQHRGSPHAHILLWLENDPHEPVSENMSLTTQLINDLRSVNCANSPKEAMYSNQVHKHTFTCTKRGESTCRFNIPFWPMNETRILLPMSKQDGRRQKLQDVAKQLRLSIEERSYSTVSEFLIHNNLTINCYLDVIRATLHRPTVIFQRNFKQICTKTFHPWISGTLNSNMDLQFILDEYSCAAYVVEYVNKSARGMSHLHRELLKLTEENVDADYTSLIKKVGIRLLNMVEMSAQAAAWYLLRQPMSVCSRKVIYISTVWPQERQKTGKQECTMDKEKIGIDSTNVWNKNLIEQYESPPTTLENVNLADFAAWYTCGNDKFNEDGLDSTSEG